MVYDVIQGPHNTRCKGFSVVTTCHVTLEGCLGISKAAWAVSNPL